VLHLVSLTAEKVAQSPSWIGPKLDRNCPIWARRFSRAVRIYVALICHSDCLIWQVTVHQNMNGRVSAVLTARLKLLVP